ncbi:MAG: NAD+ synthase, partial [Pseudomonadota bacterium]|nr:NAD+ synthase [Pseudomonadota bacterium]
MTQNLTIIMAQLNFLVGDIEGNSQKMINHLEKARDELGGDVIIFPELAITGYPPEDLLFRNGLYPRVTAALDRLKQATTGIEVIVGYPWLTPENQRFNSIAHIREHHIVAHAYKHALPNYGVFDEARYFTVGTQLGMTSIQNIPVALSICEDMWSEHVMAKAKTAGAQLMISINASPFDMNKPMIREDVMSERAQQGGMPLIYVNTVGGQDELVFDGGSMAISATGEVRQQAPFFVETLEAVILAEGQIISERHNPIMSAEARIYNALVLGVRDYIVKNGFKNAVIGVSGGIDSALTLAIAADAL